jgi:hypothetical protein
MGASPNFATAKLLASPVSTDPLSVGRTVVTKGTGQAAACFASSNSVMRPLDFDSRTCPYCGTQFKPSRSHPQQKVCSSDECQRRRRTEYHRKKVKKDALYSAVCKDCQETWKKQNPDYIKQYRARKRKAKGSSPTANARIVELRRLLTAVMNNLAKNTSAIQVTHSAQGIWLIAPKKPPNEKNILTLTHVIVIQGVVLDE